MDLGLPTGVRDFLPDAAARLTGVSARLGEVFAEAGYRRVVVPTIERVSVVERGLGPASRARLFHCVEPGTGEVVALCPDHTAQVARLWATGLASLPPPVRVAYVGPVMRAHEEWAGRPREVFQAGIECLGGEGPIFDAEVVSLCARALAATGLGELTIDLGHAGFVRAFLEAAELPDEARDEARSALAQKDAPGLETLVARVGLPRGPTGKARRALPNLAALYGQGTLDRARRLASRAGVGADAIAEVEAVLDAASSLDLGARITVDLGESRGFDYYTGLTLHAFALGAGAEVAAGGRYDDLLGRYGRPAPAVGLALDLPFLLDALGDGVAAHPGLVLAGGRRAVAEVLSAAETLRRGGHTVTVLDAGLSMAEALEWARTRGADAVIAPGRGKGWTRVPVSGGARTPVDLASL